MIHSLRRSAEVGTYLLVSSQLSIYVEVCSVCHPFYTGKQRILDTGGRVAKFEERFGKKEAK